MNKVYQILLCSFALASLNSSIQGMQGQVISLEDKLSFMLPLEVTNTIKQL